MNEFVNPRFEEYFLSVYGARWPGLYKSLREPVRHILRVNKFAQIGDQSSLQKVEFLSNALWTEGGVHTEKDGCGLFLYYKMDPASFFVAQALAVQHEDIVLDLCAAPGGKSLILAEALNETGQLISNEMSQPRRERLTRVFQEYIPKDQRQNIFVRGLDGNQYGLKQADTFTKILADVPCSGERHLLENKTEFEQWTVKRSQNLSVRQYSLLSSAWLASKTGGRIVYSTCSISPLENDEVVAKLVKRRKPRLINEIALARYSFIEKTEFGYQILPDTCGFGPMYFSILEKV